MNSFFKLSSRKSLKKTKNLRAVSTAKRYSSRRNISYDATNKKKRQALSYYQEFQEQKKVIQKNPMESKYNKVNITDQQHLEMYPKKQKQCFQQQSANLMQSVRKLESLENSSNNLMKDILTQQIISEICLSDPLFRKLNRNLAQSMVLIGTIQQYEKDELITNTNTKIGFLFFGRVKIYNKDFKAILQKGDTVGENLLKGNKIQLKIKSIAESCFLWLPIKYFQMLRESSIKNGLRNQINQLQILLHRSFINKKIKENKIIKS